MELFFVLNLSKPDLLVEVFMTTPDSILVNYQGAQYELAWYPQYSYYRGEVDGKEGYLL